MSLNTDSTTENDSIQDKNLDTITVNFDNFNQNSREIKELLKKQDSIIKDLEKKYKSLEKKFFPFITRNMQQLVNMALDVYMIRSGIRL